MTTFDKREETFEKKFAHDEELRFKASARRDSLLARWAAAKLGKVGSEAEVYVTEVLSADLRGSGEPGVFTKLRADFDRTGVTVSDLQIHAKMDEFLQAALSEIKRTG